MVAREKWWTITVDEENPQNCKASKFVSDGESKPLLVCVVQVPFWFVQFCNFNTDGPTAACERYLGPDGKQKLIEFQ